MIVEEGLHYLFIGLVHQNNHPKDFLFELDSQTYCYTYIGKGISASVGFPNKRKVSRVDSPYWLDEVN